MNEEALKDAHNLFANTGYNGDVNEFQVLLSDNAEAFADSYGLFTQSGYNGSEDDYKALLGLKKKEEELSPFVEAQREDSKDSQLPSGVESTSSAANLDASIQGRGLSEVGPQEDPRRQARAEFENQGVDIDDYLNLVDRQAKIEEELKEDVFSEALINPFAKTDAGFISSLTTENREALKSELGQVKADIKGMSEGAKKGKALFDNNKYWDLYNTSKTDKEFQAGIEASDIDLANVKTEAKINGDFVSLNEWSEWLLNSDNVDALQESLEEGSDSEIISQETLNYLKNSDNPAFNDAYNLALRQANSGGQWGDVVEKLQISGMSTKAGLQQVAEKTISVVKETLALNNPSLVKILGQDKWSEWLQAHDEHMKSPSLVMKIMQAEIEAKRQETRAYEHESATKSLIDGNYGNFLFQTVNMVAESTVPVAAAVLATGATGNPWAGRAMMFATTYGQTEIDMIGSRERGEIDAEDWQIQTLGLANALAEVVFEEATMKIINQARLLGGLDEFAEASAQHMGWGEGLLRSAATEVPSEQATAVSNYLSNWAIIDKLDPEKFDAGELAIQVGDASFAAAAMGPSMHAGVRGAYSVGKMKIIDKNTTIKVTLENGKKLEMTRGEFIPFAIQNRKAIVEKKITHETSMNSVARKAMDELFYGATAHDATEARESMFEKEKAVDGILKNLEGKDELSDSEVDELSAAVVEMNEEGKKSEYNRTDNTKKVEESVNGLLKKHGIEVIDAVETQDTSNSKIKSREKATKITNDAEAKAVEEQLSKGKTKPVMVKAQDKSGVSKDGKSTQKSEIDVEQFPSKKAAKNALAEYNAKKRGESKNDVENNDNYVANNKAYIETDKESLDEVDNKTIKDGDYHIVSGRRQGLSESQNEARDSRLIEEVEKLGGKAHKVSTMKDGVQQTEYIITGLTDAQASQLGNSFDQQSVFSGKKGRIHSDGTYQSIEGNTSRGPKARHRGETTTVNINGRKVSIAHNLSERTVGGKSINADSIGTLDKGNENYDAAFMDSLTSQQRMYLGFLTKLFNSFGNLNFTILKDSEAARRQFRALGGKVQDGASMGSFVDPNTGHTFINLETLKANTLFHEIVHPFVAFAKANDPALYKKIEGEVKKSKLKKRWAAGGKRHKMSYYNWAVKNYAGKTEGLTTEEAEAYYIEEAFAEMTADITWGKFKDSKSAVNKFKAVVQALLGKVFKGKFKKDVGEITLEDMNLSELQESLSTAFLEGREVNVGGETFKVKGGEVTDAGDVLFQNDYTDDRTGLTFTYDKNSDKFKELKEAGYITEDKSIEDFEGKYIVTHAPDAMFSGSILDKDGTVLVEGKGGVKYPIKFHEEGYFWASTDNAAKGMAKLLNQSLEKNDGKIFLALTTAPKDKLLSSTAAARGLVNLFTSENVMKKIGVPKRALYEVLLNAANHTNKEGVGLNLKLNNFKSLKDFERNHLPAIIDALDSGKSVFKDRRVFNNNLIKNVKSFTPIKESKTNLVELIAPGLEGALGSVVSKSNIKSIKNSLVSLITEPRLRTEASTRQVYAVLELDGGVKTKQTNEYDSYGMALESADGNKTTVHFLKDRHNWDDITKDPESSEIISTREGISSSGKLGPLSDILMPSTAGVSTKPLEVTTAGIKHQVAVGADEGFVGGIKSLFRFNRLSAVVGVSEPVGSEGFKDWFGNSIFKSKGGYPTVMYHGTNSENAFDSFQTRGGLHHGAFFTPSTGFAENYSYQSAAMRPARTIPVYLKVERPFDYTDDKTWDLAIESGVFTMDELKEIQRRGEEEGMNWHRIEQRIQELEVVGYDGVFIAEGGIKNISVFQPEQIRSIWRKDFTDADDIKFQVSEDSVEPGRRLFNKPNPETATIVKEYLRNNNLPDYNPIRISKLNQEKSKMIADLYAEMTHDPLNEEVASAYNDFSKEVVAQYKVIADNGYTLELFEGKGEPYKNSFEMIKDIVDNKHMFIFSTESGYGERGISDQERAESPMLKGTEFKDINGNPLLVNDLFRFVHDFFGHTELGNGFGPVGEENAWAIHSRMFSDNARRAMTAGTRGQNSWVNFGSHIRREDGSIPKRGDDDYVPFSQRPFADQKIGLLPDEITFDIPSEETIKFQETNEEDLDFKSNALLSTVMLSDDKRTPEQWVKAISEGVKGASREVTSIGLLDALKAWKIKNNARSIPKSVVENFIATNAKNLEVKELSDEKGTPITYSDFNIEIDDDRFYVTFPNGETEYADLDIDNDWISDEEVIDDALANSAYETFEEYVNDEYVPKGKGVPHYEKVTLTGGMNYREFLIKDSSPEKMFKAPHYDELGQNLISSARVDDRVGPNGVKIMFVHEIQSDWAQGKDTPDLPWGKTDLWTGLVIRKLIHQATKEGYDKIAFANGEQSDIIQGHKEDRKGSTHEFYNKIVPKNINKELNRIVKGAKYEVGSIEGSKNATINLTPELKEVVSDKPLLMFQEVTEEEVTSNYLSEQEFFQSSSPHAWAVDRVEEETLKISQIREFKGTFGVVTPDGDIKGLFNPNVAHLREGKAAQKGTLRGLIPLLIKAGGSKLDNFDGRLTSLYEANGFRVTSRTPFNEKYAPEGWVKELHGTPDVVAMIYDPNAEVVFEEKSFPDAETGYGEMIEHRDAHVRHQMPDDEGTHNVYKSGLAAIAWDISKSLIDANFRAGHWFSSPKDANKRYDIKLTDLIFKPLGTHSRKDIKEIMVRSTGSLNAEIVEVDSKMRALKKANKEADLAPEELDRLLHDINEILSLPDGALKDALLDMRMHIDLLSKILVEEGMVIGRTAFNITDNYGIYVRRSYKQFVARGWKQRDPEIIGKAEELVAEQLRKTRKDLTEEEIIDLAKVRVAELISPETKKFIQSGGSLDEQRVVSLFKQRNLDLPQEIRDLLGEVDDPYVNYKETITKISETIAAERMYKDLYELGYGKFVNDKQSSATPNELKGAKWGSLNGKFVDNEMYAIINEMNTKLSDNWGVRAYMSAVVMAKSFATVLNPGTHAKNLLGNSYFAFLNGHMSFSSESKDQAITAIKTSIQAVRGFKDSELKEFYKELTKLGVVSSSASLEEIRGIMDDLSDSQYDIERYMSKNLAQKGISKVARGVKGVYKGAEKAYQAEDDVWKIFGFMAEKAKYMKAGLTESEATDLAGTNIRNVYPNYGAIPKFLRWISRSPFIGTFVSFQSEAIRCTKNAIQLGFTELGSENAGIRKIGRGRLVNTLLSFTVLETVQVATVNLLLNALGLGDEEDDDDFESKMQSELVAPWDKTSKVASAGGGTLENGDVYFDYFNISNMSGGGMLRDLLRVAMSDSDALAEKKYATIWGELMSTFAGQDMTLGVVLDVLNNPGNKVYIPESNALDQALSTSNYVASKLGPGILKSADRVVESFEEGSKYVTSYEIAASFGLRMTRVNASKSVFFNAKRVKVAMDDIAEGAKVIGRDAFNLGSSLEFKLRVSPESEVYDKRLDMYVDELARQFISARLQGISGKKIEETMYQARVYPHVIAEVKRRVVSNYSEALRKKGVDK